MKNNMINYVKKSTGIYFILAVISLIFCILLYQGEFGVGHGGIPLIVLVTSAPAVLIFMIIFFVSSVKLDDKKTPETERTFRWYYFALLLNIIINLVSSYSLFQYIIG